MLYCSPVWATRQGGGHDGGLQRGRGVDDLRVLPSSQNLWESFRWFHPFPIHYLSGSTLVRCCSPALACFGALLPSWGDHTLYHFKKYRPQFYFFLAFNFNPSPGAQQRSHDGHSETCNRPGDCLHRWASMMMRMMRMVMMMVMVMEITVQLPPQVVLKTLPRIISPMWPTCSPTPFSGKCNQIMSLTQPNLVRYYANHFFNTTKPGQVLCKSFL